MRVRTTHGWAVVALAACLSAAAAQDSANLAPADASAYVGWSHLSSEDSEFAKLAKAVLGSPMLRTMGGEEFESLKRAVTMFELAARGTGAISILPSGEGSEDHPNILIVVDAGPLASRLVDEFKAQLASSGAPSEPVPCRVGEAELLRLKGVDDTFWGAVGRHFILASSEAAAARGVALVKGGAPSLAQNAELTFCRGKVRASNKDWHLCAFGDLGAVLRALNRGNDGEAQKTAAVLKALGVEAIKSFYVNLDDTPDGARMSAFVHMTPGAAGLAKLWDQRPLSDDDLAIIPRDAYWASAWSFDAAALWQEGMSALERISPEALPQVEAGLATATQFLGFNPVETVLPAFGGAWALYDAPSHGGLFFSGVVLVNKARDEKAIDGCMARLVKIIAPIAETVGVRLTAREMQTGGHIVHYVLVGGLPVPVAPAWGFSNGRWVFGLFPQTVATALKQIDPKTRGPSLLDNAEYKRVRALLPPQVTGVAYFDTRFYEHTLYPLMHLVYTAAASLGAGGPAEFDLGAFPTFPERVAKVRNSVGGYSFDKDGALYTGYGDTPASFLVSGNSSAFTAGLAASILLPSLARARELAKRSASLSNLRGIGMACHIYANDNADKFPPSLDVLVDAGLVAREALHSPRDNLEGESYVYVSQPSAAHADVRNVLAYERVGGEEGTCVLFVDGHVEWLKLPEFRAALRDTYRRLGRPDDLPREFRE